MRFSLKTSILCGVLVAGMGYEAGAQTTGTVTPVPADISTKDQPSSPSSAKEGPPAGGCMPIGVTVSGEIVFPFQCKDFIDQHKAAKQDQVAPAQDKPDTTQETAAAKQPESAAADVKAPETGAPEVQATKAAVSETAAQEAKAIETATPDSAKPAAELVVKTPKSKRAGLDSPTLTKGPPGCTHFRTYDPGSKTYVAYGGGRRPCP
jgi:hypothetical protein